MRGHCGLAGSGPLDQCGRELGGDQASGIFIHGSTTFHNYYQEGGNKMRKAMLAARQELGLSQEEVAKKIGMKTTPGYGSIERGVKNPSAAALVRLEKLFGVAASTLLENTVTPQ